MTSMKAGLLQNTVNPLGACSQSEISTPSALSKTPSPAHSAHVAVDVGRTKSRISVVCLMSKLQGLHKPAPRRK